MTQYIDKNTLYKLFETALYLDIVEIEPPRRSERIADRQLVAQLVAQPVAQPVAQQFPLSPNSESLLSNFSPETQLRLRRDFYIDEQEINKIIERDSIDDPLYIHFNNSHVGIYLELWVCVNIPCPGCGYKLYKYANPGMPVVDVRCINPAHDHNMGPKYYQIKATQKGAIYAGYQYFSLVKQYICVGSYRFGYNCHVIRADEPSISRQLLIGYICIEYNYNNSNHITIDMTTSFILRPNLKFTPQNTEQNEWTYYQYASISPNPIIIFNTYMMDIIRFTNAYTISLSNNYDARKVHTSDAPQPPAFTKYLIMKKKYLDLKKSIFINN